MNEKNAEKGCAKAALSAARAHIAPLLWHTFMQAVFRAAAFFCLGCALFTEGAKALWLAAFCLLYGFMILPMRFFYGDKLVCFARQGSNGGKNAIPYLLWLRLGFTRLLRGLSWGLPFLIGAGYFLWAMENIPFNELGLFFQRLAALCPFVYVGGGETARGMLVFAGLMAIFLLLFALGWRRDLPMEYLNTRGHLVGGVMVETRAIRKRARGALFRGMLTNLLLCLPAILAFAAILLPYVMDNLRISDNPLMTVRNIKKLLMKPLPVSTGLLLAADFCLLYLPLCMLRKMRNAVLIERLTRPGGGEKKNHAA